MTDAHQGEVFWVNLDPVRGSKQAGKRPVVVISGNTLNESMPIRIVCPLTRKTRGSTGRVSVPKSRTNGLKQDSDILVFQIRTVSRERFGKKIGHISADQ